MRQQVSHGSCSSERHSRSSAHLMNFITSERAYALYPEVIFKRSFSVRCATHRLRNGDGYLLPSGRVAHYRAADHGHSSPSMACADLHCRSLQPGPRRVGDGLCWTVKLRTVNVAPMQRRYPDIRLASWYFAIVRFANHRYHGGVRLTRAGRAFRSRRIRYEISSQARRTFCRRT